MLITLYGNKIKQKQLQQTSILNNLKTKRPNAIFSHLDFLDLSVDKINELINTTGGLFESKNITLLTNIFHATDIKKHFLSKLKDIANSDNAFILNEDILTPAEIKKIEKYSLKTYSFVLSEEKVNIFILSDLLQQRDKKRLWVTYHLLLQKSVPVDKIFSNFFFALKSLVLTKKFSLADSGLKNYPYQKAQTSLASCWQKHNPEDKLNELVFSHMSARNNGLDLQTALEKFILDL